MKPVQKFRNRKIDRLGDRIQQTTQRLVKDYYVLEDHIMMRNGDYIVTEDHIILMARATDPEILDKYKNGWIIEDDLMICANDTIRDDILRAAKGGYVFEDNVILAIADQGVQYFAPVQHLEKPSGEVRTLFLLAFIPDEKEDGKAWAGKLMGHFSKDGKIEKMSLVNQKGEQVAPVSIGAAEGSDTCKTYPVMVDGEIWFTFDNADSQRFFYELIASTAG